LFLPKKLTDLFKSTNLILRSKDKEWVKGKVFILNKEIFRFFDSEYDILWNDIIEAIYGLISEFLELISNEIKPLKKDIEAALEEELDIRIKPVNLRVPRMDYGDLHGNIQKSIHEFINEEKRLKPKIVNKVVYLEGLKLFGFYIISPGYREIPTILIWDKKYYASPRKYQEKILEQLYLLLENWSTCYSKTGSAKKGLRI